MWNRQLNLNSEITKIENTFVTNDSFGIIGSNFIYIYNNNLEQFCKLNVQFQTNLYSDLIYEPKLKIIYCISTRFINNVDNIQNIKLPQDAVKVFINGKYIYYLTVVNQYLHCKLYSPDKKSVIKTNIKTNYLYEHLYVQNKNKIYIINNDFFVYEIDLFSQCLKTLNIKVPRISRLSLLLVVKNEYILSFGGTNNDYPNTSITSQIYVIDIVNKMYGVSAATLPITSIPSFIELNVNTTKHVCLANGYARIMCKKHLPIELLHLISINLTMLQEVHLIWNYIHWKIKLNTILNDVHWC